MSKIYPPFNDSIGGCNPKQFVGRIDLLKEFEAHFTKNIKKDKHYFLITGNYGMGKTSLLRYCEDYLKTDYGFLTCHAIIGDDDIDDMKAVTGQILSNLLVNLKDDKNYMSFDEKIRNTIKYRKTASLYNNLIKYFGDNILEEKWRRYVFKDEFLEEISKNFAEFLSEMIKEINCKGLYIGFDLIYTITNISTFSNWFYNLAIGLEKFKFQIPLVITIEMPHDHANDFYNYNKVFKEIFLFRELGRLKDIEVREFLEDGFNRFEWKITDEILDILVDLSVGHPSWMNDIGNNLYYGYISDIMREINPEDGIHGYVYDGVVDSKADAIKAITRYLKDEEFINAIELKKDDEINELTFSILKKIANDFKENFNGYYIFKRSDIFEKLTDDEKLIFDEYMKYLEELDLLKINKTHYKFFRLYFLKNFRIWLLKYRILAEEESEKNEIKNRKKNKLNLQGIQIKMKYKK